MIVAERGGVQLRVSEESTCLLVEIHHTAFSPESRLKKSLLILLVSRCMRSTVRTAAVSVALRQLCNVRCSEDTSDIRINSKNTHKHIHMWKSSKSDICYMFGHGC